MDLSKLNPPETAPQDGSQFVAWATDTGWGVGGPENEPRWVVCHWSPEYAGGKPYWRWSVPGRSTSVVIHGWLPLPWNDLFADYALGRRSA